MIRSMTGFGEAERTTETATVRVEIRTVNHRHFHAVFRIPVGLSRLEPQMREWVRGTIARGHANCTVRIDQHGQDTIGAYRLDTERVGAQIAALREAAERFGLPGTVDLALIAGMRDLLVRDEGEEVLPELNETVVRDVVVEAAIRTAEMREAEGSRLAADLHERLGAIEEALRYIASRAPERLVAERDRLRAAVAELAGAAGVNEDRLAQEVALLAERWDINEEIVRFRSHIDLFRDLLGAEAAEPVGKRLAFLVQEMHREANTLGVKANDAPISHRVVAMKDEVERLREQVENVE